MNKYLCGNWIQTLRFCGHMRLGPGNEFRDATEKNKQIQTLRKNCHMILGTGTRSLTLAQAPTIIPHPAAFVKYFFIKKYTKKCTKIINFLCILYNFYSILVILYNFLEEFCIFFLIFSILTKILGSFLWKLPKISLFRSMFC